jgi:hypothetical protein
MRYLVIFFLLGFSVMGLFKTRNLTKKVEQQQKKIDSLIIIKNK